MEWATIALTCMLAICGSCIASMPAPLWSASPEKHPSSLRIYLLQGRPSRFPMVGHCDCLVRANCRQMPRARLQFSCDMPSLIGDGDLLFNLAESHRLTVANCQYLGNRARGTLIHSNAVTENCTFENRYEEALLLLTSTGAADGGAVNDTAVRGNNIEGVNRAGYPSGAIHIGALA